MIQKYYLNTDTLPTIPVPHDCVIDEITFDTEYLVFKFEEDISYHDSIKSINPNAVSLIIRIHLVDQEFDAYKFKLRGRLGGKGYRLIHNKKLLTLRQKNVEYLYHYVGYQSILIKLFQDGDYLLDLYADFVEFQWIENNK